MDGAGRTCGGETELSAAQLGDTKPGERTHTRLWCIEWSRADRAATAAAAAAADCSLPRFSNTDTCVLASPCTTAFTVARFIATFCPSSFPVL